MPIVNLKLLKLSPAQREIHDSYARFKVLSCGRRFGKTELAKFMLLEYIIQGYPVAYFAPSYKMSREVWRDVRRAAAEFITRSSENEGRMEFMTKGSLDFWSMSNVSADTVRGRKYKFVVIDEAAVVPMGTAIWNEVIRPLLVDMQGGALFCSTPRGRNWFYDLYMLGQHSDHPLWQSWSFPTLANPTIRPEEIEDARATTPERSFQQEYLATFLDDSGSVFRNVGAVSVLQPKTDYDPHVAHRIVFGVDWGRDEDFTAISVVNATTMEQLALERFNQISYHIQRHRLMRMVELYRPEMIVVEANSIGSVNIEELVRLENPFYPRGLPIVPFTTTQQTKTLIIDRLAMLIEQDRIKLLDHPVQRHELIGYTSHRTPNGLYSYHAPHGGHDDTVIATALAVTAADSLHRGQSSRMVMQADVAW